MRRAWPTLLGSAQCLSLRAWLLLTPVGVIAAPLAAYPAVAGGRDVLHWMLIGLVAQVPLGAVLLLGGQVARHTPHARALVMSVILLAGAVRGLTIALIGQTPDIAMRTIASSVTMAIWLLVIGAVLESHARYRREVDELLAMLVARELHGRLLDDDATRAARASSAERVAVTSQELRTIVVDAADDHARTAALLQSAIETRLRPLSHDLWFTPRPVAPRAHRRRDLMARVLTADVPVLPLFVPALVLLAWGSVVLHGVRQGALVGIAVALVYGGVLATAHGLRRAPRVAAVVRYLGVVILPAVAGEVTITVLGLGQRLSPIAVALGLPMITLGVAAAITLSADRAETVADLRARMAEPDWDRHLGDLVRREVDADTATMLHNAVQPVLTAAALQLQLAAALDEPLRAREALERAMRAIDEAAGSGDGASSGRRRLIEAADAWRGIADVQLSLPDADLVDAEWELLADVVHESIANAVRHGRATIIRIDVDVRDEAVVTVTDNRMVDGASETPGLGTTWLSSVVQSREFGVEPDGRRISRLTLPRASSLTR